MTKPVDEFYHNLSEDYKKYLKSENKEATRVTARDYLKHRVHVAKTLQMRKWKIYQTSEALYRYTTGDSEPTENYRRHSARDR